MVVDKYLCDKYLAERFYQDDWSVSRLTAFNCPYSWYETYILGKREDNYHSYIGTSFHNVMEDFYNFWINSGGLPIEEVRKTIVKKLEKKFKENPHKHLIYPRMAKSIEGKIISNISSFKIYKGITAVEREIKFKVGDIPFRGFIDLDAGLWHYDWKSRWDEKKYSHQQNLYLYGKEQVDNKTMRGFMIPQYKEALEIVKIPRSQSKINETLNWVSFRIQEIKHALEIAYFEKKIDTKFFCETLCSSDTCKHRNKQ